MAMKAKTKAGVESSILQKLNELKNSVKNLDAVIARRIWPLYQELQVERFKSQNQSEGETWSPLSPKYYKWKTSRTFFKREGKKVPIKAGGKQTLVLTGALYSAIMAKGSGGSRVIQNGKLIVNITLDYAEDVNERRNFTDFSISSLNKMKQELVDYLLKNRKK